MPGHFREFILLFLAAAFMTACSSQPTITDVSSDVDAKGPSVYRGTASTPAEVKFFRLHTTQPSVNGKLDLTYPDLKPTVDKANKINSQIQTLVSSWKCQLTVQDDYKDAMFNVSSKLDDINKKYFSFHSSVEQSCGGAHPDFETNGYVYSLLSGKLIDVSAELNDTISQDGKNINSYETRQQQIAKLLLPHMPEANRHNQCFDGMDEGQMIEQLASFEFDFSLKGNSILVFVNPPFAMNACGFDAAIPYASIKGLIRPGSILHYILK